MRSIWWSPRNKSNPIEAQQAGPRSDPQISVRGLCNCRGGAAKDSVLELARRYVHIERCGASDRLPRLNSLEREAAKGRRPGPRDCSIPLPVDRRLHATLRAGSLPSYFFRKTILPGTISRISVPDLEELLSVSLPPMQAARSRIPCNPKCPSFPLPAKAGSMPVPLSSTSKIRSRAYLSSTCNRLAPECARALRIASYPMR